MDSPVHAKGLGVSKSSTRIETQERMERDNVSPDLLRELYAGSPMSAVAHVFLAVMLAALVRDGVAPSVLVSWCGAVAAAQAVRIALYARVKSLGAATVNPQTWIRAMSAASFAAGAVWGAGAWLFLTAGALDHHVAVAMVITLLATGAVITMYAVPQAYLAFAIPALGGMLARFAVVGGREHLLLGVIALVLFGVVLWFARRHRADLFRRHHLEWENARLLRRLESEYVAVRTELRHKDQIQVALRQKSAVLDSVSKIQGLYIADSMTVDIFAQTRDILLSLTNSKCGFVGDVAIGAEGRRVLRVASQTSDSCVVHAIGGAENGGTRRREIHDDHLLFGGLLKGGEPVLLNEPEGGEITAPGIESVLAVPMYQGEDLVGVVGVANRPGGYDIELLTAIDPVVSAAAGMIAGLHNRAARAEAQREAAQAMQRLSTAIEALNDGFVIFDADDRMALCNSKYRQLFELGEKEGGGASFETLLRANIASGRYDLDGEDPEAWILERVMRHRQPHCVLEQRLADGTWLHVEEQATPDGGRVGVSVDITEFKRAQEALAKSKEEAEKASLAKTQFLSNMSHELRTPMNAVLGFAQLLQLNPQVPLHPKQRDSVEQIIKGGNHLLQLINEILDMSRIEAGRVKLDMEDVDPHQVVEECLATITPLAQKRGVTVHADVPEDREYSIRADRIRFKQVLLNLLSNAVKYNVRDGSVTFSVHGGGSEFVRFCVTDTGLGIPKEKQDELFEPFARLGAEHTDVEGTGIGLTIARKLAELMGGRLDFESVVGHGSKFWIDLPGTTSGGRKLVEERAEALPVMPEGEHLVLYVEDNPDNLTLMEHVMALIDNVRLISAHTGELGVEMAEIHRPDVVLMDINLPGINGDEAMLRLRAMDKTKDIPIIAISADAMPADIRAAMDAGFDDYLTKPINIAEVAAAVRKATEGGYARPVE
ncbi:MAG: response regulator [Alphaproteobacteria bacterium]|nr:response regulator [Alphaproteobacteria bacterium]